MYVHFAENISFYLTTAGAHVTMKCELKFKNITNLFEAKHNVLTYVVVYLCYRVVIADL